MQAAIALKEWGLARRKRKPVWYREPEPVKRHAEQPRCEPGLRDVGMKRATFQELEDAISASRRLTEIPDDFDGEGSQGLNLETWNRSATFLRRLASDLEAESALVLPTPDITLGPDGSIDLRWETDSYELLVNIPADRDAPAGFYGDDRGKITIKGTFAPDAPANGLIHWFTR